MDALLCRSGIWHGPRRAHGPEHRRHSNALVNAFVHGLDGWTAVVPQRLILSGITVALLMVADDVGNMVWRVTAANSQLAIVASAR